jgi:membrane-associated phospholipid phosphatase
MTVVRNFYPLLWLLVFWPELDLLRDVQSPAYFDVPIAALDRPIAALDRLVFGVNLHAVWMPAMPHVWLSESMFFMYVGYYALIFLPPLFVAVRGRQDALRDMTLRLMVAYTGCYLIYIALPVLGPHYLMELHPGPHTDGIFHQLATAITGAGSSRGTAFPSSHVVGAVTIAFIAWRWFPRWIAWLLTLEALGVVLATVYTQNHYAIDSLLGLVLALALQVAVVPLLYNLFADTTARAPMLPDFAHLLPANRRAGSER